MFDMKDDPMMQTSYAKAAMKKFGESHENFRIYCAEWLGDKPSEWEVMKVTGAVFREAKKGKNKGKLCIMVKGTQRTTYVTDKEMDEQE